MIGIYSAVTGQKGASVLGQFYPNEIKYLKPFNKKSNGLSSPQGTGEMARFGEKPRDF
jgi:hypothetical protein